MLNDFFEYEVGIKVLRLWPISSFKEVLPADPVIATMGVPNDLRIIHDKFEKVLSVSFTNIFLGFFFEKVRAYALILQRPLSSHLV